MLLLCRMAHAGNQDTPAKRRRGAIFTGGFGMKRSVIIQSLALILPIFFAFPAHGQWCDPDVVTAGVDGSTITVFHDNAEWNCCAWIQFALVENGEMLDLYETEMGNFCWCTCCFDLIATIEDVAPGTYLVRTIDAEGGQVLGQVWVTVEGPGATKAALGGSQQSPCGGWPTAVPDDPGHGLEGIASWGLIKALYR
jgi:hypothetical protein